jgi:hypothetical protein
MSGNNEKESLVDYTEYDLDEEQKTAVKIVTVEAKYEKAFAVMEAKLAKVAIEKDAMEIEKDVLKKEKDIAVTVVAKVLAETVTAGAPAVASGSDKKPNYTSTHQARHDEVVLLTEPALLELKKLQSKHETIWWCVNHIEAPDVGDKPDCHDSYKSGHRIIRMSPLTSTFPLSRTRLPRVRTNL